MSIAAEIARRDISEVLHFTTNRGVTGSLHNRSLLSRPLLDEDQYLRHVLQLNWLDRPEESEFFDKSNDWLRFVNLSLSEINKRLFRLSQQRHNATDLWWCILSFDPIIMTHENVWFATTNNGYDRCIRGEGSDGLDALFAQRVARKSMGITGYPWNVNRLARVDSLPTCEQAEVLYPEQVSLEYLRRIYVMEEEDHDMVAGLLTDFEYEGVEVVVRPEKFGGQPN
ncbi:hypothetical protein A9Q94_17280 [Rhodobacterales bacterium 56_14_T64]|nr:hypothetical protein A9Q94_17280 [Rhodobacterales bacterium 56_14_T64]